MSNANEPAFSTEERSKSAFTNSWRGGITKREYFAALAMQGLLANSFDDHQGQPLSTASYADIADIAVKHADAVLAHLEKLS